MSTTALQPQPAAAATNEPLQADPALQQQATAKPPTPGATAIKAKSSKPGSLSSALNLNKSSLKINGQQPLTASRANLTAADLMKLRNSGSTRVLADQQDLRALEPVRRIVTEDLRWNMGMPRPLVEFCLQSITRNVTARPFLRRLSERYRTTVMDGLDVQQLPLAFIADNIADTDLAGRKFWKRYCEHYFLPAQCDPRQHDGSWKQTFFELYVQTILEEVVPGPEASRYI